MTAELIFDSRAEAEIVAKQVRAALKAAGPAKLTVAALFEEYIRYARSRDSRPMSRNSANNAETALSLHLAPSVLGRTHPESIEDGQFRAFASEIKAKGKSGNTIARVLSGVRASIRWGLSNGSVRVDRTGSLAEVIADLQRSTKPRKAFTPEEMVKLFNGPHRTTWLADLYRIGFSTGLRIGEIQGLQWSDIHWSRKRIHLARQIEHATNHVEGRLKGRKKPEHRLIDVPDSILNLLRRRQAEARVGSVWVLETRTGKPFAYRNIRRAHERLLDRLPEVRRLPLHSMRHSFASIAFEERYNPLWISRQLGHHSVAFTLEVYAHLIMEEQDLSKLDLGVVAQTAADGDLGAERTIN